MHLDARTTHKTKYKSAPLTKWWIGLRKRTRAPELLYTLHYRHTIMSTAIMAPVCSIYEWGQKEIFLLAGENFEDYIQTHTKMAWSCQMLDITTLIQETVKHLLNFNHINHVEGANLIIPVLKIKHILKGFDGLEWACPPPCKLILPQETGNTELGHFEVPILFNHVCIPWIATQNTQSLVPHAMSSA